MRQESTSSFDAKNKVVSFRLSDSEYDLASEFCRTGGFRGMSMLARAAFLAYLPQEISERHPGDDPVALQSELRVLHAELARLIQSLGKIQQQMAMQSGSESSSAAHNGQ